MKRTALDQSYVVTVDSCDQEGQQARERDKNKLLLHTHFVADHLANEEPHRLLQARAPEVHSAEKTLPRAMRRTLAQLRAMKGPLLRAWQFDIRAVEDPNCPLYG